MEASLLLSNTQGVERRVNRLLILMIILDSSHHCDFLSEVKRNIHYHGELTKSPLGGHIRHVYSEVLGQ